MADVWTPGKLVWPWTYAEKFTGSPGDKRCVVENLTRRRLPLAQFKKEPPEERVIQASAKVLCSMLNDHEEGRIPWLLLVSKSVPLLQAIAVLAPIAYSLTTMGSCAMTNTAMLADLFFHRRSQDDDLDSPAEAVQSINLSGFLSWEGVNAVVSGSSKQTGRYSSLLEWRLKNRLLTLFTAPYHTWTTETVPQILRLVETNLGSACAAMMMESTVTNLKTDLKLPKATTLEV
jgi:hypothetical protein